MAPLTSIRTSDNKIEIVNQLVLPHTVEWLEIDTIEQAHAAIKTMQVLAILDHPYSCLDTLYISRSEAHPPLLLSQPSHLLRTSNAR